MSSINLFSEKNIIKHFYSWRKKMENICHACVSFLYDDLQLNMSSRNISGIDVNPILSRSYLTRNNLIL